MLLELEKYIEALAKAVDSGNTDLISIVLLKMQRKIPLKDFQMEVRKEPTVYALYKKQCKEQNEEEAPYVYSSLFPLVGTEVLLSIGNMQTS